MKMPEKVRLAVDLIRYLRRLPDGNPRRVEDLAVVLGTTKNFLHQVVCHLSKAGMISVVKGPKGGVAIGFNQCSLFDVYQLFGYMTEEIKADSQSDAEKIEQTIRNFLADISI